MSQLLTSAPSLFFMSSFCKTGWINNERDNWGDFLFLLGKMIQQHFLWSAVLKEKKNRKTERVFCLEYCKHSLKSGGERMAPTAGSKHSNPREDARIVKQNNPNNPSRADARETKGEKKKSCLLLRHSWDRFIIQAKANFDKQLGAISPKHLGSSLSYSQSNQGAVVGVGVGGGKVMKKCATNVPLRKKKKKTCWKKKMFQL